MNAFATNPILSFDPYELRNIPLHLKKAGLHAELHRLLGYQTADGHNAWFQANFMKSNLDQYAGQINMAWQVAENAVVDKIQNGAEIPDLFLQPYYALALASVNDSASGIAPEILSQLVTSGIWTFEQAYALALRDKEWKSRTKLLGALLPWMMQETYKDALRFFIARLDDHWAGYSTMAHVGNKLTEEQRRHSVDEEYVKAVVIRQIITSSHTLPAGLLKVIRGLCFPWCLVPTVVLLSSHASQPEAEAWQELLKYSLQLTRQIGKPSQRGEMLATLATCFSGGAKADLLNEAWTSIELAFSGDENERRFQTPKTGVFQILPPVMQWEEYFECLLAFNSHVTRNLLDRILTSMKKFSPPVKDLIFACFGGVIKKWHPGNPDMNPVSHITNPYYKLMASMALEEQDADQHDQFRQNLAAAGRIEQTDFRVTAQLSIVQKYPQFISFEWLDQIAHDAFSVASWAFQYRTIQAISPLLSGLAEKDRIILIEKMTEYEAEYEKGNKSPHEIKPILPGVVASWLDKEQLLKELNRIQTLGGSSALRKLKESIAQMQGPNNNAGPARNALPDAFPDLPAIPEEMEGWTEETMLAAMDAVDSFIENSQLEPDEKSIRKEITAEIEKSGEKRMYNDVEVRTSMNIEAIKKQKNYTAAAALKFICQYFPVERLPELTSQIDRLEHEFEKASCRAIIGTRAKDQVVAQEATTKALSFTWQSNNSAETGAVIRFLLTNGVTDRQLLHAAWAMGLHQCATDYRRIVVEYLRTTIPLLRTITISDPLAGLITMMEKAYKEWGAPEDAGISFVGIEDAKEAAGQQYSVLLTAGEEATAERTFGEYFFTMDDVPASKLFFHRLIRQCGRKDPEAKACEELAAYSCLLTDEYYIGQAYYRSGNFYDYVRNFILQREDDGKVRARLMLLVLSTLQSSLKINDTTIYNRLIGDVQHLRNKYSDDAAVSYTLQQLNLTIRRNMVQLFKGPLIIRAGAYAEGSGSQYEEVSGETRELLRKAGMSYVMPYQYNVMKGKGYYDLPSAFAVRLKDGSVEGHYLIRVGGTPADRTEFLRIIAGISEGAVPEITEFPAKDVNVEFAADRCGVVNFPVKKQQGIPFSSCMTLFLDADDLCHACVLFFSDNSREAKKRIHWAYYSLKFVRIVN